MKVLDRLEEILIATLIAAATLLIFVSVAQRYSLDLAASTMRWARGQEMDGLAAFARSAFMTIKSVNLIWAQELTIIMFVWMAKFGAAYGVRTGIHVGIDVLINRLKPRARGFFILFGLLAGALMAQRSFRSSVRSRGVRGLSIIASPTGSTPSARFAGSSSIPSTWPWS